METSVVSVIKMVNIVPILGIEPTFLAFRASVLPLHHLGFLKSKLYPCQRLTNLIIFATYPSIQQYYGSGNDWNAQYKDNVTECDILCKMGAAAQSTSDAAL